MYKHEVSHLYIYRYGWNNVAVECQNSRSRINNKSKLRYSWTIKISNSAKKGARSVKEVTVKGNRDSIWLHINSRRQSIQSK